MGSRMMRRWVSLPLLDINVIHERSDIVQYYLNHENFEETIVDNMSKIGDLEKLSSKIATARISPRECIKLKLSMECVENIRMECQVAKKKEIKLPLRFRIAKDKVHDIVFNLPKCEKIVIQQTPIEEKGESWWEWFENNPEMKYIFLILLFTTSFYALGYERPKPRYDKETHLLLPQEPHTD